MRRKGAKGNIVREPTVSELLFSQLTTVGSSLAGLCAFLADLGAVVGFGFFSGIGSSLAAGTLLDDRRGSSARTASSRSFAFRLTMVVGANLTEGEDRVVWMWSWGVWRMESGPLPLG